MQVNFEKIYLSCARKKYSEADQDGENKEFAVDL